MEYPSLTNAPYRLPADTVLSELRSNVEEGLSKSEAESRLRQYGRNALHGDGDNIRAWRVLLAQVSNALTLVLAVVMGLSFGIKDFVEGGVISAVVTVNVAMGFWQEYRAEKTMESLRSLSSPTAAILRNGLTEHVPSPSVVPGDICELHTGDVVPADVRLFEVMNFEADEALLTGEAVPSIKDASFLPNEAVGVGDQQNMAFASSTVTKGRARGVVVATGMATEVGAIAQQLRQKKRKGGRSMNAMKYGPRAPFQGFALRLYDFMGDLLGLTGGTPLQRKLSRLAYALFAVACVLALLVFAVNRFSRSHEVVLYAISVGIAIIPEALIAVLSVTFSAGTKSMARRKVIVRKLNALEALGGITDICCDKTGTLTQGKMTMCKAWVPGTGVYTVHGSAEAFDPRYGEVIVEREDDSVTRSSMQEEMMGIFEGLQTGITQRPSFSIDSALEAVIRVCAFCNLASVRRSRDGKGWQANGDPTEIALQEFACRFSLGKTDFKREGWVQLAEYPFDSVVKRMSVVWQDKHRKVYVFVKGAVERVLPTCSDDYAEEDGIGHQRVLQRMTTFAEQGLRVLAFAFREWDQPVNHWPDQPREEVESGLSFAGLAGIYDPPRAETPSAVKACLDAGIQVHMLTGDHSATARAIARDVGIISPDHGDEAVMTAAEFEMLDERTIDAMVRLPPVIARCSPTTKVLVIEALHRRGRFVAMTGDGVNDSPSLKSADVGIAMGLAGSDVAKNASDIVLTDDNFASIVAAVEEGRRAFENIQKFVLHLLVTNIAEVLVLVVGLAFRDESGFSVFPLSPIQILWINLVTSGFPAIGLGLGRASRDIMQKPPHNLSRGILSRELILDMVVYGVLMGTICLLSFVLIVYGVGGGNLGEDCNQSWSPSCEVVFSARATLFVQLTWTILAAAWEFTSLRESVIFLPWKQMYEHRFLFWAVVVGFVLVYPAVHIPALNRTVFKHTGITWEWSLACAALFLFITGVEMWKGFRRRQGKAL